MTKFPVPHRLIALALFVLAFPLHAAALTWESRRLVVTPPPGQASLTTHFHFQNQSDRTVTILSIEPSCRCLSVDTAKQSYRPGERGEIDVTIALSGRRGVLEKSVLVATDEPQTQPSELTLQITLPQ